MSMTLLNDEEELRNAFIACAVFLGLTGLGAAAIAFVAGVAVYGPSLVGFPPASMENQVVQATISFIAVGFLLLSIMGFGFAGLIHKLVIER